LSAFGGREAGFFGLVRGSFLSEGGLNFWRKGVE